MSYLYIIHSKQFDIDGVDSLYKFGCTKNIARRKFDTTYTTAFKHPCEYKCYWELPAEVNCMQFEQLILYKLNKSIAMTGGREMINSKISIIISTVEYVLDEFEIKYRRFDIDSFMIRPTNLKLESIDKFDLFKPITSETDYSYIKKEFTNINLKCCAFKIMPNDNQKCEDCNRTPIKWITIFSTPVGLRYFGAECARKYMGSKNLIQTENKAMGNTLDEFNLDKETLIDLRLNAKAMYDIENDNYIALYYYSFYNANPTIEKLIEMDNIILAKYPYLWSSYERNQAFAMAYIVFKQQMYYERANLVAELRKINVNISLFPEILFTVQNIPDFVKPKIKMINDEVCGVIDLIEKEGICRKFLTDDLSAPEIKIKYAEDLINMPAGKGVNERFASGLEYMKGLENATKNRLSIIIGRAGSGKTTGVNLYIIPKFIKEKYDVYLCAFTGCAADKLYEKYIETSDVIKQYTDYDNKSINDSFTIHRLINELKAKSLYKVLFVIDEVSMLNVLLFSKLLEMIIQRSNIDSDIRIIFMGDNGQLPPIGMGKLFYDIVNNSNIPKMELQENKRLAGIKYGPNFIKLFNGIQRGDLNVLHEPFGIPIINEKDGSYRLIESKSDNISIVDNICDELKLILGKNALISADFANVLILTFTVEKAKAINNAIKLKITGTQNYLYGDKILFTRNKYNEGKRVYFNGWIGKIKNHPSTQIIRSANGFCMNNILIEVKNKGNISVPNNCEDITFGYAMTTHKAQGKGEEIVFVILEDTFASSINMLNTAMTRTEVHCRAIKIGNINKNYSREHDFNSTISRLTSDKQVDTINESRKKLCIIIEDTIVRYQTDPYYGKNMRIFYNNFINNIPNSQYQRDMFKTLFNKNSLFTFTDKEYNSLIKI